MDVVDLFKIICLIGGTFYLITETLKEEKQNKKR